MKDDKYVFQTKVHYPNNSKLYNQKIVFNKDLKISKVTVYDKDGIEAMNMKFDKVKYSPKFSKSEFKLNSIIDEKKMDSIKKTIKI